MKSDGGVICTRLSPSRNAGCDNAIICMFAGSDVETVSFVVKTEKTNGEMSTSAMIESAIPV